MEVCGDTRTPIIKLQININTNNTEVSCLSPSTPPPEHLPSQEQKEGAPEEDATTPTRISGGEAGAEDSSPSGGSSLDPSNHHVFAAHLQMKLKSHLEESSSSSSSDEFYTNSSASHEEDSNNSTSEIFYDFDDVVTYGPDEELTSDYGTGGSNSTIVGGGGSTRSNSSSSSSSSDTSSEEGNAAQPVNGADAEEVSTVRRYQRSSSLKSGKTPPGTPMKKIVRFADAMGLDLTDIKVFLDEIPRVPKEAYRDLHIPDYNGPSSEASTLPDLSSSSWSSKPFGLSLNRSTTSLNFVPLFHQPVTMPDFFDKIRDQKVLLENAFLTQETVGNTHSSVVTCKHVIKGTVRVMNIDFHKSVYVRYTYNDWKEFVDFQATYVPGSCDGFSDRFEFRIEIDETRLPPPYVRNHDDAQIKFACRFHCQGTQFWDNNNGRNYVFQNVPTTTSVGVSRPSISSRYSSFDDFDYTCDPPPPPITNFDFSKPPLPPLPDHLSSTASSSACLSKSSSSSSVTCGMQQQPMQTMQQPPSSLVSVVDVTTSAHVLPVVTSEQATTQTQYSTGGGGGSHLSNSLYSPTTSVGFYDHAYGCYSNYGSACFY